jgi:hypothetical protein
MMATLTAKKIPSIKKPEKAAKNFLDPRWFTSASCLAVSLDEFGGATPDCRNEAAVLKISLI